MFGLMLHIAPEQARKIGAPNYLRKLDEYAGFNWATIGATVVADDRHGATEVEHNGNVYRRYRSGDDDPKGMDIRFRRVVTGTVDEKNMVWVTLIKFAEPKDRKPPRPLRGEVAERVDAASGKSTPAQAQPKPVDAPKAPAATVEPPAPVKATPSAKYAPSAEERRVVSSLLDYAGLTATSGQDAIARNTTTIRAKFAAACEAATKRGMKCADKPENLKQALEGIAAMALACVEFDAAQPEMALN